MDWFLLTRTCAFILYILISLFDFGPENLPDLSRNGLKFFWVTGRLNFLLSEGTKAQRVMTLEAKYEA